MADELNPSTNPATTPAGETPVADETIHFEGSRKKASRETKVSQPPMTSMIDVVFQLLIYFIITASFTVGEGIIIAKMPQGVGAVADPLEPPPKPLNIIISSRGDMDCVIRLEGYAQQPPNFTELSNLLVSLQFDPARGRAGVYKPDNQVIIKPEGRVRWQHVVNTFNATIKARYSNVAFGVAESAG